VRDNAIAVYYATRDGQARRIAEHICRRLNDGRKPPTSRNLLPTPPPPAELAQASLIVLVAAVRYGKHLPEVERFLNAYCALPSPPPIALASVNLSARKPGKTTGSGNPYLRKTIARHRLVPAAAVAFAGRLDYRRYNWRDRQIIRFIMLLTGGPTDPDTCIEYTSWNAVGEFADEIASLRRGG
jgi:menaquinone-dependent protoporphyrinogen oxidase